MSTSPSSLNATRPAWRGQGGARRRPPPRHLQRRRSGRCARDADHRQPPHRARIARRCPASAPARSPPRRPRRARRTADAYYGYGQYAKAAALYRAALQKGGEDPNLVNLRLGIALAQAGNRAEAETAFRAVTGAARRARPIVAALAGPPAAAPAATEGRRPAGALSRRVARTLRRTRFPLLKLSPRPSRLATRRSASARGRRAGLCRNGADAVRRHDRDGAGAAATGPDRPSAQWRQLVDLLAQRRAARRSEPRAEAYAWLEPIARASRSRPPPPGRAHRWPGRTVAPDLLAFFAEDRPRSRRPCSAAPGSSRDDWLDLLPRLGPDRARASPPPARSRSARSARARRLRRQRFRDREGARASAADAPTRARRPTAEQGEAQIRDLVARIEAFRRQRGEAHRPAVAAAPDADRPRASAGRPAADGHRASGSRARRAGR